MIDAQATAITFDGTTIGGVDHHEIMEAEPQFATFRAVNQPAAISVPTQPDYGFLRLRLYRDKSDAGQQKLQNSWRQRTTATVVITYDDGNTETFSAFCVQMPTRGGKSLSRNPVNTSLCVLKITGPIT